MLRKLDENLWVAEQPLNYMGLAVGTRMTVIRLADGGLWLHSPIRPTPPLREAVEALGPVRFLVAPNKYHHLFIGDGEVVFFHRASRTLVLTDSAHNVGPDAAPLTRFVFKVFGGYGRLSAWVVDRLINRDRAAARRTVDTILQWDIQRVILAHGHIVERDGAQAFREAYSWL
ncbi:MAG: DUF4336 domain-containing protein [Hyalangium sp.]|uniref:DUF4336 domain-containing protein n=1 Tax=Hyalangium sp. TaxID=2028555 RepID=UPI003899F78E